MLYNDSILKKQKFNEMIENQTYHDIHAHDNGM